LEEEREDGVFLLFEERSQRVCEKRNKNQTNDDWISKKIMFACLVVVVVATAA
jgi:hypothetical protein